MSAERITARYRTSVRVGFPALHSIRGLARAADVSRPHGHDFTAEFRFETTRLLFPGVVVDDDTREEIERHVHEPVSACPPVAATVWSLQTLDLHAGLTAMEIGSGTGHTTALRTASAIMT